VLDQIGVDRVRTGPLTAEEDAKPAAQRADVLGTGDQSDGWIAGPGLNRLDLQLGARAYRPIAVLLDEESIYRSIRLNTTILAFAGESTAVQVEVR
jgi:hypothetical protein